MEAKACREYAKEMRSRYDRADRRQRARLLDEFTAVTGYHRKYAIALLAKAPEPRLRSPGKSTRFTPQLINALVGIWRVADYPWSARLVAMLPVWMPHARRHLALDPELEQLLLGMSARSIDRALRSHRIALTRRIYGRTKPGSMLKHHIPMRTERWDTTEVGWCETDTVAHCGGSGDGDFACSVNVTDVASTWTETRAVLGKGQLFVVQALQTGLSKPSHGKWVEVGSQESSRRSRRQLATKSRLQTGMRPTHEILESAHRVALLLDKTSSLLGTTLERQVSRRRQPQRLRVTLSETRDLGEHTSIDDVGLRMAA